MKSTLVSKSLLPVALAGLLFAGGCHNNPPQQNAQQAAQQQPAAADQNANPAAANQQPPANNSGQPGAAAQYPAKQPGPPTYKETPSGADTAAAAPASYTIPAGTSIRVRLGEALSSKTSQAGQTFQATVQSPVTVRGKTVIRSGSTASGTVVTATSQGRFKGAGELDLRLDSIRANGREYPVQTSNITRVEKGKGKRTAVMAGGGGGLGAIIGGLAGGGKGALIGGLAGAGAGTAGSAFTGNQQVTIPAETVLTFTLEHSVTVR